MGRRWRPRPSSRPRPTISSATPSTRPAPPLPPLVGWSCSCAFDGLGGAASRCPSAACFAALCRLWRLMCRVACVSARVPNPPWRAWQAQGQVREAKDAEKEVMDKYLALFKQHTTADERLVCLRAALAHACLCRRLCVCCHARDSSVLNAARRLQMPMLLAPLSTRAS